MTHPLIALSEQEIFNQAMEGLAGQDWKQSYDTDRGHCMYTLTTPGGTVLHCALGHIDPTLPEGTSPLSYDFYGHIDGDVEVDLVEWNSGRGEFLKELQKPHDNYEGPEMREAYRVFALRYGLELPDVLKLD